MSQKKIGLIVSYIYSVANIVIGFFMSIFILRKLGMTKYGVYQSVAAFATYLVLFEFGVGTVMSRNIAMCRGKSNQYEEINKNISTVLFITFILSIAIAVIAALFYANMGGIYHKTLTDEQIAYGKWLFLGMALYILISFCNQAFTGICNGFEYFKFTKLLTLICLLLRTVLVIALVSISPSPTLIVLADLFISAATLIATVFYCIKQTHFCLRIRYIDKAILMFSLPMTVALFLQGIVNQANNNVDKFLISIMLSPESVSIYSIGMFVYTAFSSISTVPISIFQPSIVKWISERGVDDTLTDSLVMPSRLLALTGGAILFGFIACGRPFIHVFYGSDYDAAWYVATIVMIPMFLNMFYGLLVNVLDALGKRMVRSVVLTCTTIANIAMTVFAIRYYGIVGAAVATGICTLVGQVFAMNFYYKKYIGIRIGQLTKAVFKGVLPALLLPCCIAGTVVYFIPNQTLALIIGLTIYLLSLLAFLLWFGLNKEEKLLLQDKLIHHSKHGNTL